MTDPRSSAKAVSATRDPIARARDLLHLADHADLAEGTTPDLVLLELVRGLARDLAGHFTKVPSTRFNGILRRRRGPIGWVLPPRFVPHKVLLGRYLAYTPPTAVSEKYTQAAARIAVVALGEDGMLRRGVFSGNVIFPADVEPACTPLAHDDLFLTRVPPSSLLVHTWTGGDDPVEAADPAQLLEAILNILERITIRVADDQALVTSLLQPRESEDRGRMGSG